ncbi:MAG: hypothetical protein K2Y22_15395 [Candidatus Obscuribacterales bacterium]|nr:hypothetical protein [Candidatus Obscuribacterales bacterium]
MADGNKSNDRPLDDHSPKTIDANKRLLEEIAGRGFQLALIGEGLVAGGIKDAGKELRVDNLWNLGGEAAVSAGAGSVLGAVLVSKQNGLKLAIGAIGTLGGMAYTACKFDQYSKNKELSKALDSVYKKRDWKTFDKQTKTAEKILGKEGFDAGFAGLTGSAGLVAGMKFAPGLTKKYAPAVGEYMFGKVRGDKVASLARQSVSGTPFNRDLKSFVNKVSHGDVHVAKAAEQTKTFIFDKDNRISNIFIRKGASAEDIQRHVMVGSLADKIGLDKSAFRIAMEGAEKANYHAPRPYDLERAAAEGVAFADSQVGQLRKLQGAQRYSIEGSEAYLRKTQGNDYTEYLRKALGPWSGKKDAEARSLVVNVSVAEPTDVITHRVASENLAGLGMQQNEFNLAAAKNKLIQGMDEAQKKEAVRAVSYYLKGHPISTGLSNADRNAGLEKLSRELTPLQIDLITKRMAEFDPQYFPHHWFEGQVLSAVDNLVSSGIMRDATKTHKLLCKLAGQVGKANVEAADLLINCARSNGMSEEQLMKKGVAETGAKVLKELLDTKQNQLIVDLALALKHLEARTSYKDVFAVRTMRDLGFKSEDINAQSIADHVGRLLRKP